MFVGSGVSLSDLFSAQKTEISAHEVFEICGRGNFGIQGAEFHAFQCAEMSILCMTLCRVLKLTFEGNFEI